jgi:hypothetical protein
MSLAKQLDTPPSLAKKGVLTSGDLCESDPSFNGWLSNLPKDDWTDAIDESALINVIWVDGVGFVRQEP